MVSEPVCFARIEVPDCAAVPLSSVQEYVNAPDAVIVVSSLLQSSFALVGDTVSSGIASTYKVADACESAAEEHFASTKFSTTYLPA